MNRHVKKIKSIFFYQKDYTEDVIEDIEDIKDTSFVAIYNPECIGIMNATIELFGKDNSIKLYEIFNDKQISNIANAIVKHNFKQVIFSTMAYGYKDLAERIYELNSKIKIKFMWHGSHALFVNYNEQSFLEDLLQLQKRGIVHSIGFFKSAMADFYLAKGYNAKLLMNDVNIKDKDDYNKNKEDKRLKIGLYSSGDRWEKNTYNQLSACAMVKDAYIDIIPETKLATSFCKLMSIKTVTDDAPMSLKRKHLLRRMANNDVNLYVTFTECSPMIPLESFELGVPCIIGNNTDYFKNSKLNDLVVVKEEDNIDEIYDKINICLEKRDEIMNLYKEWKKDYSEKVKKLKEDFLND